MTNWKEVPINLDGDIRLERDGKILLYSSYHGQFFPMDQTPSFEGFWLLDKVIAPGVTFWRTKNPDWDTFREWIRVYYNDLESHAKYKSPEQDAYQNIVGLVLNGGSPYMLHGDLWEEMTQYPEGSVQTDILAEVWSEIGTRFIDGDGPPLLDEGSRVQTGTQEQEDEDELYRRRNQ